MSAKALEKSGETERRCEVQVQDIPGRFRKPDTRHQSCPKKKVKLIMFSE